jgi:hypothetical protein
VGSQVQQFLEVDVEVVVMTKEIVPKLAAIENRWRPMLSLAR